MKYKILSILIITVLLSGCENIQRQLSMEKKENVDEFLIQKKNPLVLPPEFSKLPKPRKEEKKEVVKDENLDLSEVLGGTSDKNKLKNKDNSELEKSILKVLKDR